MFNKKRLSGPEGEVIFYSLVQYAEAVSPEYWHYLAKDTVTRNVSADEKKAIENYSMVRVLDFVVQNANEVLPQKRKVQENLKKAIVKRVQGNRSLLAHQTGDYLNAFMVKLYSKCDQSKLLCE